MGILVRRDKRGTSAGDVVLLREAALDIEDMIRDLNEEKSLCATCGVTKYEKFEEHLVANALKRIPSRLRKAAELLENVQKYGRVAGKAKPLSRPRSRERESAHG